MFSYLADNNSEYKKAKGVNKKFVLTISHNEYKNVFMNKKCLRHSMNRIQSKDHKIGTYEINKTSLSYFDNKIYIQNNACDGSSLGYKKDIYHSDYLKKLFCQENCSNFQSNEDSFFIKHIKFEKCEILKKELNEELMTISWHAKRWWDWCVSEDEKKRKRSNFYWRVLKLCVGSI